MTIPSEVTLSLVRPNFRELNPWPPPSASPAIPTDAQEPLGMARPAGASFASTSIRRAPAPIVTIADVELRLTELIRLRSTTSPVPVE